MSIGNGYSRIADALGMAAPRPKLRLVQDHETEPVETHGVWRPTSLDDYIGQDRARLKLRMHVSAALKRGQQPGHILLSGAPGLGKTSMAAIVAALINHERPEPAEHVAFHSVMGSAVRTERQLAKTLVKLGAGDVLLIDECHQMTLRAEEMLGLAMEDRRITVSGTESGTTDTQTIVLPAFTVVLASTKPANLSLPLRNRAGLSIRMDWYADDELAQIVKLAAQRESVEVTDDAALAVARVGRQTPRIALSVWSQVVAFAATVDADVVDADVVELAFDVIELDSLGLDQRDRDYLTVIASWCGRRAGLAPVAAKSGLDEREIDHDVEPYLLRAGLIDRSSRGRCLTRAAYAHMWPTKPIPPLLGLS